MKWIAVKVIFKAEYPAMGADLIANLFHELGLGGVMIEDPLEQPADHWENALLHRPEQHAVVGYVAKGPGGDTLLSMLSKGLSRMVREKILTYHIKKEEIDEIDWATAWKRFFKPRKVGRRIVIKPTWREYISKPGEIVLDIDPGMAFGTGTHPSTMLCIRLLETFLKPGQSVLDIGTGSGILLLAAAKLGAGKLYGVDKDPQCVSIARENILLNDLALQNFQIQEGDLVHSIAQRFDLIVANILCEVIVKLLDDINAVLNTGGVFICSGIIDTKRKLVEAKMAACGMNVIKVSSCEGWVALVGVMASHDFPNGA